MPRGPKPKTKKNSRLPARVAARVDDLVPTSDLNDAAMDEFVRLARTLSDQGRLDNVDVGVMTSTADDKAMLDRMNKIIGKERGFPDEKHIAARNGVKAKWLAGMRALGLTVLPSRSVVKTTAKAAPEDDKWAGKLKVAGY
jgi:hypothetical protein